MDNPKEGESVFWQRRYETQHRKVHAMEDVIARYRDGIEGAIESLTYGNGVDTSESAVESARMLLRTALGSPES